MHTLTYKDTHQDVSYQQHNTLLHAGTTDGYRWRRHFGLAPLLQRCPVFISDLLGQSEQRTKGHLLPVKMMSLVNLQHCPVMVARRKWWSRCAVGWIGKVLIAVHAPMVLWGPFPAPVGKTVTYYIHVPISPILTANDVWIYACCIQYSVNHTEGPTSCFPKAWVHCTHLVECVDPSFGGNI